VSYTFDDASCAASRDHYTASYPVSTTSSFTYSVLNRVTASLNLEPIAFPTALVSEAKSEAVAPAYSEASLIPLPTSVVVSSIPLEASVA